MLIPTSVHNISSFLLILTKGDWIYYVQKLELTLNKRTGKGLKCNIENYFFGQNRIKYLGLWVTRYVIKPIDKTGGVQNKEDCTRDEIFVSGVS